MADEAKVDVTVAMRAGAQELGAQVADLTLELAVRTAMSTAQAGRIRELDEQLAVKDAELERMRVVLAEVTATTPDTEVEDGPAP